MRKAPPSVDELLDLVGLVYASALDPAKITNSLQALKTCMDLAGSQKFTFHRESGTILDQQMCAAIHSTVRNDSLNHWGNVDPRAYQPLAPCRQAMCCCATNGLTTVLSGATGTTRSS